MATIQDLCVVLAELEDEAGDPDVVLAAVHAERPHRSRRRVVMPLVAAAAVVAVAVAAVLLVGGNGSKHAPAAAPAQITELGLTDYAFSFGPLPDGFVASYAGVATEGQGAYIRNGAGDLVAVIDIYPASQPHPATPTKPVAVTVNGHPAVLGAWNDTLSGGYWSAAGSRMLLWQDPAGPWISMIPYSQAAGDGSPPPDLTTAQILQIADAIQVGQTHPVKLDAKFAYLPALPVTTIYPTSGEPTASGSMTSIELGNSDDGITLSIGTAKQDITPEPGDAPQTIDISGFTGQYSATDPQTLLQRGDVTLVIGYGPGQKKSATDTDTHAMPLDELTKIVQGISLAPSQLDQSTWFDAADALPN